MVGFGVGERSKVEPVPGVTLSVCVRKANQVAVRSVVRPCGSFSVQAPESSVVEERMPFDTTTFFTGLLLLASRTTPVTVTSGTGRMRCFLLVVAAARGNAVRVTRARTATARERGKARIIQNSPRDSGTAAARRPPKEHGS